MKYFSMLIKPASSRCNLKCKYCFYHDVSNHRYVKDYGIMDTNTSVLLIDNVLNTFNEKVSISFAFQGGEPMLAGLDYFEQFVSYAEKNKKQYHHISYSIQTNATLIDENWCRFFSKHNFLVGVSLDGYQEINDFYRGANTFNKITNAIKTLEMWQIKFNILTVLTEKLAQHPNQLYNFYKTNGLNNIQLIPCLSSLDDDEIEHLKPKTFYTFYNNFYDLWYSDLKQGYYMSIQFFDDTIRLFKGLLPYQCGALGFCTIQYVIEADGSVYPCDFYVLDKYKMGNIKSDSIISLANSAVAKAFISESKQPCKQCEDCKFINICHQKCKRVNICYYNQDYCGLRLFLENNEAKLIQASKLL
ncbi:MAG: SPASM domain-containing protein [Erysipelotrichaceae bacterium]|nr:SPASM domain-containing protein [Erysipelotrichaceae bacterium]